jgi:formylglycine-generating enzyme required for sulfatase activity
MSLAELYTDLLRTRDPSRASALAGAVRASRPLEALLLDRFAREGTGSITVGEGSWRGRTAWIGPHLPNTSEAGQLWLDTIEITVMVSVAREPPGADWHSDAIKRWTPLVGWLALHPVAVWQYRAYLTMAKVPDAASPRILRDVEETVSVTRVTGADAFSFADWMGKQLPSQLLWQAARGTMGESFDQLWGASGKEWFGYPEPDEDEATALSLQTLDADPYEERDAGRKLSPARRMLYGHHDLSPEIGFRTAVLDGIGLLTSPSNSLRYPR